jgi:hypothetical protein
MPDSTIGRRCLRLWPWTLTLLTILSACGGQPVQPSQSDAPTRTSTSQRLVVGRSATPTEIDAPGIQVPIGSALAISIGKYNLIITATDWDTIIGSSQVANLVRVKFAPDFNATKTVTRNRFQYLADKISQHYNGTDFEPLSIVSGVSNGTVVDIAALYNASGQTSKITALKVTITNKSSMATVAAGTFYSTRGSAITIPGRTIYFTRLRFSSSSLGPTKNGQISTAVHFRYDQVKL